MILKILLRTLLQWLPLALLNFGANVFAWFLVNWWAPLLARPITSTEWLGQTADGYSLGLQRLPRWLAWFDTFDASTDAGWNDGYFVTAGTYTKASPPSFWRRKGYQILWLYRNTAYRFAYGPLGIPMRTDTWRVIKDTPSLFMAVSSDGYWQITGPRFNFGWKAHWYWTGASWKTVSWGPAWRTQIVLSFSFKS